MLSEIRLAMAEKLFGKDKQEKSIIKDLIKQPDDFIFSGQVKNGELTIKIKKGDMSE